MTHRGPFQPLPFCEGKVAGERKETAADLKMDTS